MRRVSRLAALVAALLIWPAALFAGEAHWPASLTIGTASPGGTYYAYGEGLAKILTQKLRLPVVSRATDGPNQNIQLLESGEVQIAFVTLGAAQQAWNGTAPWTAGKPLRSMRAMFPMYDTPFQFMTLQESGIQKLADLKGRRVGVGPETGTAGTYVPQVFRTLGIEATLVHGEWANLAAQVQAGTLDALAVAAGVPFPSFTELERKSRVRFLTLSPSQIVDLRLAIPELGLSLVPAGLYPSLSQRYVTIGLYNFAVAHSSLPDDLVYAIVAAVFSEHERMMEIHSAAGETVPANFVRNTFLPFHNGASRWYRNQAVLGTVGTD
jgi:TRAP transporter TAXI family solute receptor